MKTHEQNKQVDIFSLKEQGYNLGYTHAKKEVIEGELEFLKNYLEMLEVPSYAVSISDFEKKQKIKDKIKKLEELK